MQNILQVHGANCYRQEGIIFVFFKLISSYEVIKEFVK